MKSLYSLAVAICMACSPGLFAQPLVQQKNVSYGSINLRQTQAVVLQSATFGLHPAGTVVVRFDGVCCADSGDRMILAASNIQDWGANDGSVGIQVANAASQCKAFSHTRIYTVSAGTDTFYAVGQNYVNTDGSGLAGIYGSLTIEFFPATAPAVPNVNMGWSGNMAIAMMPMDSIFSAAAPLGKAYVHIDGQVYSDPGDRIMLSANYVPEWTVDNGSVAVMAHSTGQRYSPYTHSRVFDITGNPNTFYAVSENVVDQGGSGSGTVYGNLSAEFFPAGALYTIDQKDIIVGAQNLRSTSPVLFDSIVINAAHTGKVLLQFDGYVQSTFGDGITLAASDTRSWGINEGNATVHAASVNEPFNIFSHSRLYTVTPGSHTFYCMGQNWVDQLGTGVADVLGNFSAKYYPDANVGVNDVAADKGFSMYPNPVQNNVIILFPATVESKRVVEIADLTGRILISADVQGDDQIQINIGSLPAGLYLVHCGDRVEKLIKE